MEFGGSDNYIIFLGPRRGRTVILVVVADNYGVDGLTEHSRGTGFESKTYFAVEHQTLVWHCSTTSNRGVLRKTKKNLYQRVAQQQ